MTRFKMDLRPTLASYRDDPDHPESYVANECHWDDPAEMLVEAESILGLCGCGLGTDFDYILGGLEIIEAKDRPEFSVGPGYMEAMGLWVEKTTARENSHFGNQAAAQFFYKWADREGLAEHGSSVPGWLTDEGKRLLSLMREAAAMGGKEGE